MRRAALYGIGWVAAATVAVLLAWQGVGLVGRNVTDPHPRALTADQARAALEASGTGPAAGPPDTGSPTTSPPGGGNPSAGAGSTTTTSRPRSTATTTPRPPATSPTATPTTRPAAPSTTPTTTAGVVRTYNLIGGSATLRFEPGKVTVVWANPNPGFRAEIDDRSDGGVRVRFDGASHRSEVEAWWDGGPQDRVEDGGGGGGGSGPG